MLQHSLDFYKRNQKIIRLFALVTVLALFVLYAINNWDQFSRLQNVKLWQIILIVIGQLLILLSSTLMFMHISTFGNSGLSFGKAFKINTYSALVNFFGFLQGGVGVRAGYLKVKKHMPLKTFFLLTLVQYFSLFYISVILIFFSLLLINGQSLLSLVVLIIGIAGTPILKQFAYIAAKPIKHKLTSSSLRLFFFINLIQIVGCILSYGTELYAVGAKFSLSAIILYAAVTQFAIVLAITPGALGVKEFLLLVASQQMGLSLDDIILSSTLDRLVLFITFILILPFAISIKNDLSEIRSESQ